VSPFVTDVEVAARVPFWYVVEEAWLTVTS
ncbi:MAG: hypothetical protein QOI86_3386, partial [Actinomycetota bacterium]|nr:hypothetical protein [Actinomycetota bacterium]